MSPSPPPLANDAEPMAPAPASPSPQHTDGRAGYIVYSSTLNIHVYSFYLKTKINRTATHPRFVPILTRRPS